MNANGIDIREIKTNLDQLIADAAARFEVAKTEFLAHISKTSPCIVTREDVGDEDRYIWIYYIGQCGKELAFPNEDALRAFIVDNGITTQYTY
jgi:hypothetical protein